METRKEMAVAFLRLAASPRAREAFARYAGAGFRHHNPHFASDADSLAAAMEANARQFPQKQLEVLRALEDPGFALVHLFRFEGEKVAELWDLAQQVPESSPNAHGMF
jgi:predicted SnoaL-like aldol condensation-catalyzing enzyme